MTLSVQFLTMLAMIVMGGFFGASLDTYNRFLKRSKRKGWIVFCNDILFWCLQALFIFYVLYLVNRGELRFYIFIALLCGFAFYQSLLKKGYLIALESIIRAAISVYRFIVKVIFHMIYRPSYTLVMMIISILVMLGQGFLTLAKFLLRIFLFLLNIILKPFKWMINIFWGFVPRNIQKLVKKLYNKVAGFIKKLKNYLSNALFSFTNKRK